MTFSGQRTHFASKSIFKLVHLLLMSLSWLASSVYDLSRVTLKKLCLILGISPILTTDEASPKCAFKEKQERVLNQGLSVQSTRTLLESAQSFHPGPEKVDAAQVLIEPASCQTPKRAIVAPLEILQERLCGKLILL